MDGYLFESWFDIYLVPKIESIVEKPISSQNIKKLRYRTKERAPNENFEELKVGDESMDNRMLPQIDGSSDETILIYVGTFYYSYITRKFGAG